MEEDIQPKPEPFKFTKFNMQVLLIIMVVIAMLFMVYDFMNTQNGVKTCKQYNNYIAKYGREPSFIPMTTLPTNMT